MEHILIKVYGNIRPVSADLVEQLQAEQPEKEDGTEALELSGEMLLFSFEGMYYPIDEVIEIVTKGLTPEMEGKIDYIDLDEWTLTRYTIADGNITHATRSLNHVMAYSGH